MKKHILVLFFLCALSLLPSCKTALHVAEVNLNTYGAYGTANMEFIGFKNLNRNNIFSKDYGKTLEQQQIAFNRQNYYMGVYSLQELASYKSSKRYVAFVDVISQKYIYNDAIADNYGLEVGGWIIAGITCFALFPVYVPMICAADKNECLITLRGEYILYVYDTEKKEIALTIPMEIEQQDHYEGQYLHKETDKLVVQERYRNMLYNLWTENFYKAYRFIDDLQK